MALDTSGGDVIAVTDGRCEFSLVPETYSIDLGSAPSGWRVAE